MTKSEWRGNTKDKTGVGVFSFDMPDGQRKQAHISFESFEFYQCVCQFADSAAKDHTAYAVRELRRLAKDLED